ncbi:hypothetical protein C9374_008264 [Naegleria lovaniensis]|uniref:Uncharacterized protein n=1 Tax=Naegleria lovaniensis TaxID=51637 RepID=A0AA88KGG7_NAELO|nr:uncharacterized protein C9374_008264 [Naegleria lovaniensis]KAG2378625.1 hypothetical protein C9374_008264 [Naegleria lovaniensis]
MKKTHHAQQSLQFKPKKMVLQLLPRTEQLYKEINARGFNPGIQIKFKETKSASYVVQYLMTRWSTILAALQVQQVRIYPRKINFGCATHSGWGIESTQHAMNKVKREVVDFHLHGSNTTSGNDRTHQEEGADEPFIMEYDFIYYPQPSLVNTDLKQGGNNNTISTTTQVSVPNHSWSKGASGFLSPPCSSSQKPTIHSVLPQKTTTTTTSSSGTSTMGFITSFADVSHVLDSMRSAQQQQQSSLSATSINTTTQFPSVLPTISNQTPIASPSKNTSSRKRKTKEETSASVTANTIGTTTHTNSSPKKKRTTKKKKTETMSTVEIQNNTVIPKGTSQNKLFITPSQVEASLSNFLNTADINSQFSQINKLNNIEISNLSELFNLHFGSSCKEQSTTNFGSLFGSDGEGFNMNHQNANTFKSTNNLASTTSFVNTSMTPSKSSSNILHIISHNDNSSLFVSLREKSTGPIDDSLPSLFA